MNFGTVRIEAMWQPICYEPVPVFFIVGKMRRLKTIFGDLKSYDEIVVNNRQLQTDWQWNVKSLRSEFLGSLEDVTRLIETYGGFFKGYQFFYELQPGWTVYQSELPPAIEMKLWGALGLPGVTL